MTNGIKKRIFNYGGAVSDLLGGFANKFDNFTDKRPQNFVQYMKNNWEQNRSDPVAKSTAGAPPIQDPFGSQFPTTPKVVQRPGFRSESLIPDDWMEDFMAATKTQAPNTRGQLTSGGFTSGRGSLMDLNPGYVAPAPSAGTNPINLPPTTNFDDSVFTMGNINDPNFWNDPNYGTTNAGAPTPDILLNNNGNVPNFVPN